VDVFFETLCMHVMPLEDHAMMQAGLSS